MDENNPVVRLCAQGMAAEGRGEPAEAGRLFTLAWEQATGDYERCIAAHYVARQQKTPQERLTWNQRCLDLADLVGDESVAHFYPSLHVNLGRDHEELGHKDAALAHFAEAVELAEGLPQDGYGTMLLDGARAGLRRAHDM